MASRTATVRLDVSLTELHDPRSGRIDASKVADFLGVALPQVAAAVGASYGAVHKTPDAPSLQKGLGPMKRSLTLLSRATRSRRDARAWLNTPHPDLGEKTPLDVILDGHADALVTLLENTVAGLPT
jgi:antitoxin Xre/MbcA/ParS-like protein